MNFLCSLLAASGLIAAVVVTYLECLRRSYLKSCGSDWDLNAPLAEANRSHNVTPAMLREPTCCCGQMIEPSRLSAYWRSPSAN